jgi:hypothetical protein
VVANTPQSALKQEPEYLVWTNMKARCYTPSSSRYARYGERGIRVCERWRESYQAFLEDMGRRPSPDHQIDRRDNDGDYTPKNCRWATRVENSWNRSATLWIEANGEKLPLAEWARRLGANPQTIADRLDRGWSPEDAVSRPPRSVAQPGVVTLVLYGREQRLFEWAKETGLTAATICKRLKRGWSIEEALTIPSGGRR